MGQLTICQKVIAAVESFEIKSGNMVKYTAKKKILAMGSDYEICQNGQVVAVVDQKVANLVKTFDIIINGQKCGTVKKKFPAITKDMDYEARGWKLDGDALGMNFKFTDANKNVYATVKKKVLAVGDTYEVEFVNDSDELLIVALTIIIDEAFHSKRS